MGNTGLVEFPDITKARPDIMKINPHIMNNFFGEYGLASMRGSEVFAPAFFRFSRHFGCFCRIYVELSQEVFKSLMPVYF